MSNTPFTVTGNLTADPELRFTQSGHAVANFTVASTPRKFNKQTSEWEDGVTLFMRCSVWRQAAENVAESLTRGTAVIATGNLVQRDWEDKQTGQKRSAVELQVDEVGPSLARATAQVTKNQKGGQPQQAPDAAWGQPQQQAAPQSGGWSATPAPF